jgi:hypothetical protein
MEGEMQENVEHVKQDIEETVEHQVRGPFSAQNNRPFSA